MAEQSGATIEVVYALPHEQRLVRLPYEPGMTARDAVTRSGLGAQYPEIGAQPLVLGIFGTRVEAERALEPGDRVEICRPLTVDPRDLRRQMLARGTVMGGAGKGPRPQRKADAKS
jgi:uncharacterized protein